MQGLRRVRSEHPAHWSETLSVDLHPRERSMPSCAFIFHVFSTGSRRLRVFRLSTSSTHLGITTTGTACRTYIALHRQRWIQ